MSEIDLKRFFLEQVRLFENFPADKVEEIFRRGFSTKPSDASGRGVGLALVQVVCERRGGTVSVHNDGGAVFTARMRVGGPWRT